MTNLVTIDNAIIDSLMASSTMLAEIPCLVTSRDVTAAKGCGSCQRRRNRATYVTNYTKAKSCIASLGGAARSKLKTFLAARQCRVTVIRNGRRETLTF